MVFGGEFGRGGSFDGHEGLPHVAINDVALFGDVAVIHLGPIVVDDCVCVSAGLLFVNTLQVGAVQLGAGVP